MKTVLITGAGGGIGKAIAETFVKENYFPILHYHQSQETVLLANQLNGMAVQADLSEISEIENMTRQVLKEVSHIDVLVNNAGMSISGLLTDISPETRKKLFAVNVLGAIECTRLFLPSMIHRKAGAIINISSMWGQVGASCEVDYSASKAAIIGFTKALAQEVAPSQIRVNCIAPGVIQTKMLDCYDETTLQALAEETPLQRLGTPQDIAKAVYFLSSEQSSFITGQILGVNGGFVM